MLAPDTAACWAGITQTFIDVGEYEQWLCIDIGIIECSWGAYDKIYLSSISNSCLVRPKIG